MEVEVWEMDPLKPSWALEVPAFPTRVLVGRTRSQVPAGTLPRSLVGLWESFAGAGTGPSSRGLPSDTLDAHPMFFPSEVAGAHTIRMSPCYG